MTRPTVHQLLPLALCWTLAASLAAAAQSPAEIEEARAVRLVQAIGSGDAEKAAAAFAEEFAPSLLAKRPAGWERLAQMLASHHGGMEVAMVEASEPHHLEVVARDPGGAFRLVLDFEPEAPHKIAGFSISSEDAHGGERPKLPPLELSDDADADRKVLAAWFDRLAKEHEFSGAALVRWQGDVLLRGAWGLADRRWSVPNRVDTRFDLGSINKSFTRISIARLLSEGRLALDDTVAELLPDYPSPDVARRITVQHLLDHTSGLPDLFGPAFFQSSKALYRGPRDFFPLFVDGPLDFEPGQGRQYSNSGFMVLGAIIEELTGKPYSQVVEEWVFEPAGMTGTGFFEHDEPVPNVADGYTRQGETGEVRSNVLMLPAAGNSAGSAYSTVEDLVRFDDALREHRLLSPGWTGWYFGGAVPSSADSEPAGTAPRDATAVGIAGGAPGVNALLESDGELVVAVLSNMDPPLAESAGVHLFQALRAALSGEDGHTALGQPSIRVGGPSG